MLDPVELLNELADACTDDRGFWILTSIAARLNGHPEADTESIVRHFFPEFGFPSK